MEAVFALQRVPHAVLMHLCEDSTELCRVRDAHCHVNEGAEVEVAVKI